MGPALLGAQAVQARLCSLVLKVVFWVIFEMQLPLSRKPTLPSKFWLLHFSAWADFKVLCNVQGNRLGFPLPTCQHSWTKQPQDLWSRFLKFWECFGPEDVSRNCPALQKELVGLGCSLGKINKAFISFFFFFSSIIPIKTSTPGAVPLCYLVAVRPHCTYLNRTDKIRIFKSEAHCPALISHVLLADVM